MKREWLCKIMNGTKVWEIRGSNCVKHKNKTIYFACNKKIHGSAFLHDVEKLNLEELENNADKTGISNPKQNKIIDGYIKRKGCYAYKLRNIIKFRQPICFEYDPIRGPKLGPPTWNTLPHYLLVQCQKAIDKGIAVTKK